MKILIIGAGIAGLSCATSLQAAGHEVVIFDKSRGPAGRMSTRRNNDIQWDHGAQYFTARDPRFRAEVLGWTEAGAAAPWMVDIAVIGDVAAHTQEAGLVRYVGTPCMNSPAKCLSESLTLNLQHTVMSVRKTDSGWLATTVEHGQIDNVFDAVILAIPAPQATPLLELLEHPFAVHTTGADMVGCWTLILSYKGRQNIGFDAAFVNQGPLRWVARDSSKPERKSDHETWVLQASAGWSAQYIEANPTDVVPALLAAFKALGASDPDECIAHRWRYADTPTPLNDGFFWDNQAKLGVCGDWINGGKVEGAWLSGLYLAEAISP